MNLYIFSVLILSCSGSHIKRFSFKNLESVSSNEIKQSLEVNGAIAITGLPEQYSNAVQSLKSEASRCLGKFSWKIQIVIVWWFLGLVFVVTVMQIIALLNNENGCLPWQFFLVFLESMLQMWTFRIPGIKNNSVACRRNATTANRDKKLNFPYNFGQHLLHFLHVIVVIADKKKIFTVSS